MKGNIDEPIDLDDSPQDRGRALSSDGVEFRSDLPCLDVGTWLPQDGARVAPKTYTLTNEDPIILSSPLATMTGKRAAAFHAYAANVLSERIAQHPSAVEIRGTIDALNELAANAMSASQHSSTSVEPNQHNPRPKKKRKLTADEDGSVNAAQDAAKMERVQAKQRKDAEKEQRRLEKEAKMAQRARDRDLEVINRLKLSRKDSVKEMKVDMDVALYNTSLGELTRECLAGLESSAVAWSSGFGNLIKWQRFITATYDENLGRFVPTSPKHSPEQHILIYYKANELVDLLSPDAQKLEDALRTVVVVHSSCRPILLIEGMHALFRKMQNRRNRVFAAAVRGEDANAVPADEKIDIDTFEQIMLNLQINHRCLIIHTTTAHDSAAMIATLTQDLSTIPYKKARRIVDTSFCTEVGQVRTGSDPADTFLKMLQEVLRVTLPIARAITSRYADVTALTQVFRRAGQDALEDVCIGNTREGLASTRRVGPTLSRHIYNIFTNSNPRADA